MIFQRSLKQHVDLFNTISSLEPQIEIASEYMAMAIKTNGKIMFCGNGGSAADSQHLAAEFIGRFVNDRSPLPAIALTTDSSVLTCIGNDYAFDDIFSRQIQALGAQNDVLVAISTSGNSKNVINAISSAKDKDITVIGLLGKDGGQCKQLCDVNIIVPNDITARIQEAHIFIGHVLVEIVENKLGLA